MRLMSMLAVLALSAGCAVAQNPPAQRPPAQTPAVQNPPAQTPPPMVNQGPAEQAAAAGLSPASGVDEVLDALDKVGQGLADFTADVTLKEADNVTGDSFTRQGKVWYQKKADGDARLRVLFDKPKGKNEYLLDKGWLVDRDYRKRIETNRQVVRPGEKINLLKLGEGPFPLPIGQKKEDVHRLFAASKIEAKAGDPANTVHLELTPNPGSQFERKFSVLEVWVDVSTHMPRRIETVDKNQTTTRTTDLENIKVNAGVKDADFALPAIDANEWQRHDEPYAD